MIINKITARKHAKRLRGKEGKEALVTADKYLKMHHALLWHLLAVSDRE